MFLPLLRSGSALANSGLAISKIYIFSRDVTQIINFSLCGHSCAKIFPWPWSGPDGESQIREKIHGLAGTRYGCPRSDLVVIGDWPGRVFHLWPSLLLAIFAQVYKKFLQLISLWSFGRNFLNYSVSYVSAMAQTRLGLGKLCLNNSLNPHFFFQGRNSNYQWFILWSFLSKILQWPWSGQDGESQIRDKIHGLTGARYGCPGSDLVVIGDWLGRVFHLWPSPFLAIFAPV